MKTLWLASSLVFVSLLACQTLPNEPARGTQPTPSPTATPPASPTPSTDAMHGVSPAPTPTALDTTSPPVASVSFANDIQPIFNQSCTQCHSGGFGFGAWTEGNAFNNLVNVKSVQNDSFFRVKPNDSANSLLYLKISQANPSVGSRMPLGGSPLSDAQQTLIKNWIDAGAPNN